MEYRPSDPKVFGLTDEDDVSLALHDYVQGILDHTEPDHIMDSLVIMANICEMRSHTSLCPTKRTWYQHANECVRVMLDELGTAEARPDMQLEDPTLYYPDNGMVH